MFPEVYWVSTVLKSTIYYDMTSLMYHTLVT